MRFLTWIVLGISLCAPFALAQQFVALGLGYHVFNPVMGVSGTCAAKNYVTANGDPATCIVEVSSAGNDGTCSAQPPPVDQTGAHACATWAKGFLLLATGNSNHPDWILGKKGDSWSDIKLNGGLAVNGFSPSAPFVIGAFPTNATGPRPLIRTKSNDGVITTSASGVCAGAALCGNNVAIIGIEGYAYQRDPANGGNGSISNAIGMSFSKSTSWMLIEDVKLSYYSTNLSISPAITSPNGTVILNQNVILNSYEITASSSGVFVEDTASLTITNNVVANNGWNASIYGAITSVQNHNFYIQDNNLPIIFSGNISANNAAGDQGRPGGLFSDNLFFGGPIGFNTDGTPSNAINNVVTEGINQNLNPVVTSATTAASNGVLHLAQSSFTGAISGTTLTVTGSTGTIGFSQLLRTSGGTPLASGTRITTPGSGGDGTYTITPSQTVSAEAMTTTPFNIAVNMAVSDLTTPSSIGATSKVTSINATNGDVTIVPANTGLIGLGDQILFGGVAGDGISAGNGLAGSTLSLTTSALSNVGDTQLHFAGTFTPGILTASITMVDVTNPAAIPFDTLVSGGVGGNTSSTVNLNKAITSPGIAAGDNIVFSVQYYGGNPYTGTANPQLLTNNIITNRLAQTSPDYGLNYGNGTTGGTASGNVVCGWGATNMYVDNTGLNTSTGNTFQANNCNGIGPDPANATLGAYAGSIGLTATSAALLTCAENLSRDNWLNGSFNPACMAHPVNNFMRGKLGVPLN